MEFAVLKSMDISLRTGGESEFLPRVQADRSANLSSSEAAGDGRGWVRDRDGLLPSWRPESQHLPAAGAQLRSLQATAKRAA